MRVMSEYQTITIKPKKSKKVWSSDRSHYIEIVNAERKSHLSAVVDKETLEVVLYMHYRKVYGHELIMEMWGVNYGS